MGKVVIAGLLGVRRSEARGEDAEIGPTEHYTNNQIVWASAKRRFCELGCRRSGIGWDISWPAGCRLL